MPRSKLLIPIILVNNFLFWLFLVIGAAIGDKLLKIKK